MSTTKPNSSTSASATPRLATGKRLGSTWVLHATLVLTSFLLVLPFVWLLLTSVNTLKGVGTEDWIPAQSAALEKGQFSDEVLEDLRQRVLQRDTPLAVMLADTIDFESPDLNRESLANQLTQRVIEGQDGSIYTEARFQGVVLSRATQRLLKVDDPNPQQVRLLNGWLLHDAFPELIDHPRRFRWYNYREVFRQIPYARYYINSIFIACWVTFLQVLTSSMAAFAFSRLDWPGRDKVFLLYLSTMMLPGLVMMIPNFQIMIELGWVDTFQGLIVPAAFTAFGTFLLRQFMLTIPREMDEAAEIDGASKWRVYWDVILPMARPGLITLAIFTFMGNFHSFFWPLVMLKSQHRYTLPIGLLYFDSSTGQETTLMMAAVAMSVIPMIIVFVTLQKYLVKGIQLGAVKG